MTSNLNSLYTEAAYLVCLVKGGVCRLKTGLYNNNFKYDLRKIYALASKTLNSYGNLLKTLQRANLQLSEKCVHLSTKDCAKNGNNAADCQSHSCRQCHFITLVHDILEGPKHSHRFLLGQLHEFTKDHLAVKKLRHAYKLVGKSPVVQNKKQKNAKELLPCYARVNLLKTTLSSVLKQLVKSGFEHIEYSQSDISYRKFRKYVRRLKRNQFMLDYHLPHILLVFPYGTSLHELELYKSHCILIQDKASCFSAEILQPNPEADVIDACAAPGNKTLQLVSMLSSKATIFAIDRDPNRFRRLSDNLTSCGVDRLSVVDDMFSSSTTEHQNNTQSSQPSVQACLADFLSLDPYDPQFSNVQSILLDPSCSGSGLSFRQPDGQYSEELQNRKPTGCNDDDVYNEEYSSRLKRLSNLQALLLKHALNFPNVQRVVYSTCSIHPEENEAVVRENADRVSDKFYLETIWPNTSSNVSSDSVTVTTTSPAWKRRGLSDKKYQCESCIRSSEEDLTTGFFVALFVRRKIDKPLKKGSSSQPLTASPSTTTTTATKTRTVKRTPVNCQSSFTTADENNSNNNVNNKAEKEEKSIDDKQEETFTFKVRKKCRKIQD